MKLTRSYSVHERAAERRDSVAGGCAERRSVGGHAGRTEPDSRGQRGDVHLGRWIARRLHPLAAGGYGWVAVDRHAARLDALDEPARACRCGEDGDLHAGQRAGQRPGGRHDPRCAAATCGWRRWPGCRGCMAGAITNFTTANGLSSNVVTALLAARGWHAADRHAGSRLECVGRARISHAQRDDKNGDAAQTTVHAILDDGSGHLWFATGDGIARCDVNRAQRRAHARTGSSSARPMGCAAARRRPTAILRRGARAMGCLWFATPKGLVEVDPAHFPVNTIPPPVALERFAVDDVAQPLRGADSSDESCRRDMCTSSSITPD